MNRLLIPVVVLLGVTACIPKGKYNELLIERDRVQTQLDGTNTAMNELSTEHNRTIDELEALRLQYMQETGKMEADIAEMQLAMAELEEQRRKTDELLSSYKDLVAKFQKMIDAGTLSVKVVDGRMIVELATAILVPPGSASLSKEGKTAITEVATVLASIEDRDFQVAGHTDDDPIRTDRFPSNWHLGSGRAIAVTDLLIDSGLPANRVSASSYGDTLPTASNATKEGKAANRRIEIVIMPDLTSMPGYEELANLGGEAAPEVKSAPEPEPEPEVKGRPIKALPSGE